MSDSNDTHSGNPYRSFFGVGVITLLILLATAGVKSYRDLTAAQAHEAELNRQIVESQERIRILQERAGLIANDPRTLERLAREDLDMVRPGDVVIVLPEEEPAPDE